MSEEQDKLEVSLEPPKLFGRKKKSGKKSGKKRDTGPAAEQPEPAATPEPPATEADEAPETEVRAEVPEADQTNQAAAFAPPTVDQEQGETDPAANEPAAEQLPRAQAPAPETGVLPPVTDDEPIIDEIETGLEDEDDLGPATPAATAATKPSLAARLRDRLRRLDQKRASNDTGPRAATGDEDTASRGYTAPILDHYPAAVLTGAIVGLGMVVLTWLSLRGCEAIRGTATCGGGPGFLLLVAMFIVSVMLGSAILKSFEVPDPGSSSFLAVGLVAVIALLLLIDALDHWSMLLVIPVVTVGAYALSVFVTKTFVEPEN